MKTIRIALTTILGDENRQKYSIPIFSIILSLLVGIVILASSGANPFMALFNLLQGSGLAPKINYPAGRNMLTDFMSFLNALTPMIFGALAVAIALKGGLFNIGVAGQMLAAGFMATIIVGYSELNSFLARPLVLLVGIITGALVGGLIGFLKFKFNINEVVSSIMLNHTFQFVTSFFISTRFLDPISRQSRTVSKAARLTLINHPVGNLRMDIPFGIIIALITVFAMRFIIEKTILGFEIKAVGSSKTGAKYIGIPVGNRIVLTMIISGALAGLAGVTFYLGYFGSMQPRVLPELGFDAIAVSLLGNSNPLGILFSSFIINIIRQGSTYMSSQARVDIEVASVITALILLFSACGEYFKYKVNQSRRKIEEKQVEDKKEVSKNG